MENPNNGQVLPLINVVIDKIHGGRKQDRKFWQRGSANSRNEYTGFSNKEIPNEQPEGFSENLKITKVRRSIYAIGIVTMGCVFALVYIRPDLFSFLSYSKIYQTNNDHFPDKNENQYQIGPNSTSRPSDSSTEPRDYKFSPEQVSRARRTVLQTEKNKSNFVGKKNLKENFPIKSFKDNKHRYEIELSSGRFVYADSVIVTDDKITFENIKGLVVSVDRSDVKTLKKLN
ncbi:MAG: hypothetical protein GY702_05375 [Desulfobulbaceae bacterium]|nr:hypothetical protein [Desulfobulbaceae bacterium]